MNYRTVTYCKPFMALYDQREAARDALNLANGANRKQLKAAFDEAQQAMDDHRATCRACTMTAEVRVAA